MLPHIVIDIIAAHLGPIQPPYLISLVCNTWISSPIVRSFVLLDVLGTNIFSVTVGIYAQIYEFNNLHLS